MKKFSFRLESVLRVRRIQEDQVRARLTIANRDVLLASRRVDARQVRYDSITRPAGVLARDDFDREWFRLDATAGAVRHAVAEHAEAVVVASQIRSEWVEAKNRTEILERLRTRAHDEWQVDARRDEDRVIDDLIVGRHHLRNRTPNTPVHAHLGANT